MKLIVEPIWPWPLVVLVILGLLALVWRTYRRRVRHLSLFYRRLLLGLRLAAAGVLGFSMLRPALEFKKTDSKSAVLLVVGDISRSMNTQDGPGGKTRRDALLQTLADCEPQFEDLSTEIEIRHFDFAEALVPVEQPGEIADGDQTAIGNVLESLLREAGSSRIAGVLLLSDGAQRAVAPYDADPRAKARLLGQHQVPVYTFAFGGTGLNESVLDLAVEDLLVDPLVFEKKVVVVSAKIRALGAMGRDFTVRLLVEDRLGKRPGEAGEMKVPPAANTARPAVRITATKNSEVLTVELSYVPQRPGEFKIALVVEALDGELKQANNRQETIITVQKGGINVAYFDNTRPEQRALRIVNTSDKIQLDFQPVYTGRLASLTKIDPEWFQPGRYDVYIIGDVSAEMFGPRRLSELAARVEEGAGLMMTGGYHSFGPGGYAQTPLEPLLPVAMSPLEIQTGTTIDRSLHHFGPTQMLPTERGLREYVMRLDAPEKNRQRWQSLAPLEGANKLRKKNDFVLVLAESPDRIPLLFSHEVGAARVMAFAGDTTYQWVLAGHRDAHQRFWRQVILWLSRKELDGDQPVWARVDPGNFNPKQHVGFVFGARDDKGQPITDADFTVEVIQPNAQTQRVQPRRSGNGNTATFVDTESPGDYWVKVSAEKEGQSLGFDAWTRFIVDARDLEMDNPAADISLLEEISALTGGSFMPPEQLQSFLERKLDDGQFVQRDLTTLRRVTLWDNWPLLLLFVTLMSIEWFLRKRRGLV